jgi:hypothetical protein
MNWNPRDDIAELAMNTKKPAIMQTSSSKEGVCYAPFDFDAVVVGDFGSL